MRFTATVAAMVLMRSVPTIMMARARLVTWRRTPKSAELASRSNSPAKEDPF